MNHLQHLVFYDGNCGLCDQAVQFLLKKDKKELFVFASLQGLAAEKWLTKLPPELKQLDTIILVENYLSPNYQVRVLSNGVFRIAWLLGGFWKLFGVFSYLPSWTFDWAYRFVARHRHSFFSNQSCVLPTLSLRHRFLDE